MDFIYDEQGRPRAMIYNNVLYLYVLNLQGDVIRIVNTTGATMASYVYDAWGKVISSSGTLANVNPLRYRGYYYDTETALYYLQSRYYDPEVKRFINADTFASTGEGFTGYNMFAYCNNDPINRVDPTGHYPDWVYKYFGTAWNYEQYCKQYGYGSQTSNFRDMGIKERDYYIPSSATNVSISTQSGTTTRTKSDVAYDRVYGAMNEAGIALLSEVFFQPIVGHIIAASSLVYGLFANEDSIPGEGVYTSYSVILEYDKADEVSGRIIHFYNEATYLQAYTSAGEKYLYRDSAKNYSYPAIILGG